MTTSLDSYGQWRVRRVYHLLKTTEVTVDMPDGYSYDLYCRSTLVSEWLWIKHSLQMFRRVGGYGKLRPPQMKDIEG